MQAVTNTRPYATKAWQVLTHIAGQPGRESLHPLLTHHGQVNNVLVLLVTGDRGLAGAYTTNIVRFTLNKFGQYPVPVSYITVGRKGRDLMFRRGEKVIAEFSNHHRLFVLALQILDVGAGSCEFINSIKASRKIALDINKDLKKI